MAMMRGVTGVADAGRERHSRTFGFANANVVEKKGHSMLAPTIANFGFTDKYSFVSFWF